MISGIRWGFRIAVLRLTGLMKQSRALRGRNPARDSQVEGTPLACVAPGQRPGATFFGSRGTLRASVDRGGNIACAGSRLNGPDGAVVDEREGAAAVGCVEQGQAKGIEPM